MDIFYALADPTRRNIISELRLLNNQSITQLTNNQSITRQAITKHLNILTRVGIVKIIWKGREKHHSLNPDSLKELADWLKPYARLWDQRLDQLTEFLGENNE